MVILKDYEYLNKVGIIIIKLMEQLINQKSNIKINEQEVSF